jgi:hypothetical protein
MPLHAVPMVSGDIQDMYRIRDSALLPTQAPVSCLLFRPPLSIMHQREIELLKAASNTIYLKALGDDGMIAAMRARMVPQRSEQAVIAVPAQQEYQTVGAYTWEACYRQMTEAKKESFANLPHIC